MAVQLESIFLFLRGYMFHPDTPEEYRNAIVTGDARTLAERIPDESVGLVMADPVYWQIEDYVWLSELSERILKPDSACLLWQGQQWLEETIVALHDAPLRYRWVLGWYASNNMQMVGKIGRNLAPLLWYEKGRSNPIHAVREVKDTPIPMGNAAFKWAKRPEVVAYYLGKFTCHGSVVYDPFTGGGTVPAVCKMLGRNFIASEIDPETAERARLRLEQTQPPLFTLEPEQSSLELMAAQD
jgi:DNA modification methylase